MPRLNTSNAVKERIEHLLTRLLAYANHDLPADWERLQKNLTVRWSEEESDRPKLIVKTELRFLAELVFQRQSPKLKETLKQDLQVLSKFLDILEDNRTKTQGSAIWHFTLTLWYKSVERNLQEFQRQWAQRKSNSKPPEGQSSDRQQDIRAAQNFMIPKKSGSLFSRTGVMLDAVAVPSGSLPNAGPVQSDSPQKPSPVRPGSNLPARDYATFIGREQQLAQVLELLSFNSSVARISVEGIGGVGKTSLVLEAAHRCLQSSQDLGAAAAAPMFDAIAFTSAKPQHFTPRGILPRFKRERTLGQIFRAIARTLNCPGILAGDFDDQVDAVQSCLSHQQTLLIVDNLETLEEQEFVLSFLYDLPATVKAIVTSRDRTLLDVSIHLSPLDKTESLCFIEHQSQLKTVQLSDDNVQTLYQGTGGMPAAMVYAIGQLANGYPLPTVLPRLTETHSDFCHFYFESALHPLRGQNAHQLLMALALFPQPALQTAIAQVALPDGNSINTTDDFARLHQLSLIAVQGERCDMLPLTREYMLVELAANPQFEREARERWVRWYLRFSKQHSQEDWKDWNEYARLEAEWENIQDAIQWCIECDRYAEVRQFWQAVKGYTYFQRQGNDRLRYWDTCLEWTDWLIQTAEQQQDWSTAVSVMLDRGWTLTLMGQEKQLQAAGLLLNRAWKFCDRIPSHLQIDLAIHIAVVRLQQQQFDVSERWLTQAAERLGTTQLDPTRKTRFATHILYYQGEICYKIGDYDRAKQQFQQALKQAQSLQWQRATFLINHWLADIAIQQNNLDTAQQILQSGLQAAQDNHDQCRAAFCKRSFARLEKVQGNLNVAYNWATEAQADFLSLGMLPEAEETQALLQTLSTENDNPHKP